MAEIKHPQFFLAKPDNVDLITHVFTDLATPAGQGVTVNYFPIQPFSSCPRLEERIEPLGREHARKYWVELKNKYGLAEISGDTALRATNYEYVQLLCLDRSVRLARVNAQVLVIKSEHDREAEELVEKLKREEAAYANFKMFIRKILGTSSTDTLACLEWATQRGDAK